MVTMTERIYIQSHLLPLDNYEIELCSLAELNSKAYVMWHYHKQPLVLYNFNGVYIH